MAVIIVDSLCLFKQKTAYEMRISDWSSDVCSSDLPHGFWLSIRALSDLLYTADLGALSTINCCALADLGSLLRHGGGDRKSKSCGDKSQIFHAFTIQ